MTHISAIFVGYFMRYCLCPIFAILVMTEATILVDQFVKKINSFMRGFMYYNIGLNSFKNSLELSVSCFTICSNSNQILMSSLILVSFVCTDLSARRLRILGR